MIKADYRKSPFTRYAWLSLSVFFIIFCSCPVKRYFKLQLYKESSPIESSSNNAAFAKELKDINYIDKHCLAKTTTTSDIAKPRPRLADALPIVFILSVLVTEDLVYLFRRKTGRTAFYDYSHPIAATIPLYLRCNRLQV